MAVSNGRDSDLHVATPNWFTSSDAKAKATCPKFHPMSRDRKQKGREMRIDSINSRFLYVIYLWLSSSLCIPTHLLLLLLCSRLGLSTSMSIPLISVYLVNMTL